MPELRLAQPKDADAIRHCARHAYQKYVERIGREPAPMVADFEEQIRQRRIWVLQDHNGLCGYAVFYPLGDQMFLENVAIDTSKQGRGYGRQLMDLVEREAVRSKLTGVSLYTNVLMHENLELYRALGYQETERRREDGFDRVYFLKRLP